MSRACVVVQGNAVSAATTTTVPKGEPPRAGTADLPVMSTPPPQLNLNPSEATARIQDLRLMTAIKSPYDSAGRLDLAAFDNHVEDQIANGVEALIIGGTTGEGHLFNWGEHIMLIAHTKSK